MMRQELVSGCKECGCRISASDEKSLKKKRRAHANLHLSRELFIKTIMERAGLKDPRGKLVEHIERLVDSASHDLHHEFQLYLRFVLEKYDVWSRLKVNQKGSLEYMIKQEWRYLSDEEKTTFTRYAREFIETLFPEFTKTQENVATTEPTV